MGNMIENGKSFTMIENGKSFTIMQIFDLKPTRVVFNNPATIVFWNDGTKTVVKCSKDDVFDRDKGFVYAVLKKTLGSSREVSEFYENNIVESKEEIK